MKNHQMRRGAAGVALAGLASTLLLAAPPAYAASPLSISDIQGAGAATPYAGQTVTTEPSVVTAVYGQGSTSEFRGFVIQEPGSGEAKASGVPSEAIFIFAGNAAFDVEIGDAVSVTGTAGEFQGLTQIAGAISIEESAADLDPVTPVEIDWASTAADRENYESMLVETDQRFLVSDTFPLFPFGEIGLTADDELPLQPTELPAADRAAQRAANAANMINLDDGTNKSMINNEIPYLSQRRGVSVGDTLMIKEPVIVDFRNNKWKFNPTRPIATGDEIAKIKQGKQDKRPNVKGDFSVASFNVLNYFTTLGQGRAGCVGGNPDVEGNFNVAFDCDARGAWDAADLLRQQSKIVNAINRLDASVVGLMEIENSIKLGEPADEATHTLVNALNKASHYRKWAVVPSSTELQGVADQDVITNALIYQPREVTLQGKAAALGAEADADGAFANARTPIAAAFTAKRTGESTLVVVNHFKSKSTGDDALGDNADTGDGQGAFNGDRTRQAKALVAWLPALAEKLQTEATVLVGDFNSYTGEDPMQVLYDAGFVNAASGDEPTYNFSGLSGSLDHILLDPAAKARMTKADVWSINSGESQALEYAQYNRTADDYYAPSVYRSSDHDPVIVGLKRGEPSGGSLTVLNINDFHGRLAPTSPNTVAFFGTVEEQRKAAGADRTLFLSAGDNIGASLFASSIQADNPTIEVLNAAGLDASAVGNHEFDKGFSDLTGRVADRADWTYLGANVYTVGTTTPALPEYALFTKDNKKVAVIGAVTEETGSLVSPAGISTLEFGDPVDAVNRVAAKLSDGRKANGEADVIIAEYHEGAIEGQPSSTLADQLSKGGAFAKIVNQTSAEVDVIFTAHTHQAYAWDGPIPGKSVSTTSRKASKPKDTRKAAQKPTGPTTRPILQTGSYGANLGKVTLRFDSRGEVKSYTAANLPATTTPVPELVQQFPAVAEIQRIVTDTLETAEVLGSVVIGEATAPISRAFITSNGAPVEDRAGESTVSNLVANMFRDSLADPLRGGAQIGIQNPGGNRADLDTGDITFSEAAAVLPFANTLVTLDLTGAQFKTALEQQWQTNADGSPFTGSRPYLQLGLSDNVSYTYDATQPWGSRITSITIDGVPYDPAATYRIGTASFLASGGDNFRVIGEGANKRDSGLIDLDSWTDYIKAETPITPSYARRAVAVGSVPTTLTAGETTTLTVGSGGRTTGGPNNTLDLGSVGSPANTTLTATLGGIEVGTATVTGGVATLQLTVPAGAAAGSSELLLTATPSQTVVRLAVTVTG